MEEFDEFGPGATPKDALTAPGGFCAPVTGSPYMLGYPDAADVMREAARYLAMFDGQTLTLAEGPAAFRAGNLPRVLAFCADRLDAEAELADAQRVRDREAHQRHLERYRRPAAVAFFVLRSLGRLGNPVHSAAYRLNRAYGFTDGDDYRDDD
jgi:hypothetical protein